MTREDYDTLDGAFKEAEKDDTPFLVPGENELAVVGDANKTEINAHDFEITFRIPEETDGGVKYRRITKEFKGVYITPRRDSDIVKALTVLLPFFRGLKPNEKGEIDVTVLSEEEKQEVYEQLTDKVYDAMYDVVAAVLRIDLGLKDYMLPGSVMDATAKIVHGYHEVVNEADTFFE